ncbi:hypothetical protein Sm713_16050 [Streptomyces sp. TS71-3]|nr:hypothetical protein Sm713_16050 [Streptomyces sp. TS71-3]
MDQALQIPADMFRFTTGERAPLYSAILHAFGEANERLVTALSLDEVRGRLRGVGWFDALTDGDLVEALGKLREWQLLDAVQNHAGNYRTAEEYERRNLQYSLTRRGEAAFAGVQHVLTVLASSGALQTAVLDAIADRLHALAALLSDPSSEDRRVFTTLQELEGHLDALRSNTKQFNGELQRLLHTDGADLTVFREVKAATVAYLREFLSHLDQRAHAIAGAVARVEELGVGALQARALAGAELPPMAGGDPAPAWTRARRARWEGLRAWFLPGDGTPRVEQLHHVARRAIVTVLQVLDRINQARLRSSSAAEDFRELARWFAHAPSDEDLHVLWATAFGLGPARQFDRPELAPLWRAVHDRLSSGRPVSRITVGPLDLSAREALADLLGLDRLPPIRTTVALARLDEALLAGVGSDSRAVAEAVLGPVGDRAADRETDRAATYRTVAVARHSSRGHRPAGARDMDSSSAALRPRAGLDRDDPPAPHGGADRPRCPAHPG